MSIKSDIEQLGAQAREASRAIALLSTTRKNEALRSMAQALREQRELLKSANKLDMEAAKKAGLNSAMLDRLQLTDTRIEEMASGLEFVAELSDPVGQCLDEKVLESGLRKKKIRVPIGVIGIIYESRPNVTADATALCFKAGNAVILRGGSEALNSNRAIAAALQQGGQKANLPAYAVQLVQTSDREAVKALVQLERYLDLIIPRGGEGLIRAVTEMSRVPVIKHYKGVCHTYVHEDAEIDMAVAISENAKCQRPAVCNAMETLLVHQAVSGKFLPAFAKRVENYNLEMRGDERTRAILTATKPVAEEDWSTEYNDFILSIRVVDSLIDAIQHINHYGSGHSDAIVTQSKEAAEEFLTAVDSATVYVNASTRFTDGAQFGMGAEIGISTDKLHARGPMGLEELTSYKYVLYGDGQIRR